MFHWTKSCLHRIYTIVGYLSGRICCFKFMSREANNTIQINQVTSRAFYLRTNQSNWCDRSHFIFFHSKSNWSCRKNAVTQKSWSRVIRMWKRASIWDFLRVIRGPFIPRSLSAAMKGGLLPQRLTKARSYKQNSRVELDSHIIICQVLKRLAQGKQLMTFVFFPNKLFLSEQSWLTHF